MGKIDFKIVVCSLISLLACIGSYYYITDSLFYTVYRLPIVFNTNMDGKLYVIKVLTETDLKNDTMLLKSIFNVDIFGSGLLFYTWVVGMGIIMVITHVYLSDSIYTFICKRSTGNQTAEKVVITKVMGSINNYNTTSNKKPKSLDIVEELITLGICAIICTFSFVIPNNINNNFDVVRALHTALSSIETNKTDEQARVLAELRLDKTITKDGEIQLVHKLNKDTALKALDYDMVKGNIAELIPEIYLLDDKLTFSYIDGEYIVYEHTK